jgi:hypothetical protein
VDTFIFLRHDRRLDPCGDRHGLASKFAGVTAVWLIMAWRARRAAVAI